MPGGPWRFRVAVVLALVACHAALFYGIAHTRAARSPGTGGRPMFGPVISRVWQPPRGSALAARAPAPIVEDTSISPPRDWVFPPIDVWPSPTGWSPALTEFTPVTEARADPPDGGGARRRQKLRMVRWLRPAYPADLAAAGVEGAVLLDLKIDPSGVPVETTVTQSSGSTQLDQAAVRAASLWRFAPPLWKSRPVEVTCRIEIRFHSGRDPHLHGDAAARPGGQSLVRCDPGGAAGRRAPGMAARSCARARAASAALADEAAQRLAEPMAHGPREKQQRSTVTISQHRSASCMARGGWGAAVYRAHPAVLRKRL